MTRRGSTPLAEAVGSRSGGQVVAAKHPSSEVSDVVVGEVEHVLQHDGKASFAVVDGSFTPREVDHDWSHWFAGMVETGSGTHPVTVLSRHPSPQELASTPIGRCVAIIAAYNEVDILDSVVRNLRRQEVEVYVIDNWSTDGTFELAHSLVSEGIVIGVERFPEQPSDTTNWESLLRRKAEVAVELEADWAIHNDADEIRLTPWPRLSLRDGLAVATSIGSNAVDFTVVDHPPTDDSFQPGDDVVKAFPWYRFGDRRGHFRQIKAWQAPGQVVDMGPGHNIKFPGRRLFPFNFIVCHYPVRSQAHGERKVLVERRPRWDPSELREGWHRHYNDVTETTRFNVDPSELDYFDHERLMVDKLGTVVARLGLEPSN